MKYLLKYPFIVLMFIFAMIMFFIFWVFLLIWNLKIPTLKPMDVWKAFIDFREMVLDVFRY